MGRPFLFLLPWLFAVPAHAGDLVYTPINPSFGGSPLNSAHLLGTANAQRSATARDYEDPLDFEEDPVTETPGQANADLFVRQLQSRLFSSLAAQVNDAIFGDDPRDQGTVTFGSTTVEFARTTEEIQLVITDALDGTVTEISVPQLVTTQ
jgi:curli production assembly/transport component CsgF